MRAGTRVYPIALRILQTVAKDGLPLGESALYNHSLEIPASFAVFVIPFALATVSIALKEEWKDHFL